MKKSICILCSSVLFIFVFALTQNLNFAQIPPYNGIYLFGSIENDKKMSGYFGKNQIESKGKNWCIFVGQNSKVYKISLIERNIHELYINGQKISDNEIWKHTAEYKSYLEKFWRNEEIEADSRNLEQKIKTFDLKIETISKEIENLDRAEEKLDKETETNRKNIAYDKKSISSQRNRLEKIQNEFDEKIETYSKEQENLSNEQETLDLMDEMNKVLLQIGSDLKALGVVKTSKNLSFKLSNLELIVNGKKVSSEVLELLKSKYIFETTGESGFIYNWKGEV